MAVMPVTRGRQNQQNQGALPGMPVAPRRLL